MKKIPQLLILLTTVLLLALGRERAAAQDAPPNFDPEQMRQRMQQRLLDNVREKLVVTNDADWNALEPLVSKVTEATMADLMGQMRGLMPNRGGGQGGGFPGFGAADPDAEALQNLLDANAPHAQIKAALAKYRESVQRKKADLEKAKDQLRQALSVRQEATLVSMGLL